MLAIIEITPWHWAGFLAVIFFFLALDLGVFHREAHVVNFKEALAWSFVWFALAMLFAGALVPLRGDRESLQFLTGYIIELSLSMDNVFVMALIFAYFRVPSHLQHRVLFWGILGALLMRGAMIWVGVELITRFEWILYLFGAFLVFSAFKMLSSEEEGVHPEKNPLIRLARKLFPVATEFDGQKFFTTRTRTPGDKEEDTVHLSRKLGQFALTPLALVLLMVETTDLIFALDSIPAIFGITSNSFVIFTSNIFAILGLRSLYFVLANAIQYFHYLKYGLALVLAFIGVKMMIDPHHAAPKWFQREIPTNWSLAIVLGIILVSIAASLIVARRKSSDASPPDKAA